MDLLKTSLLAIFTKIFLKPLVKGTLRYRKIKFLTTSALFQLPLFVPKIPPSPLPYPIRLRRREGTDFYTSPPLMGGVGEGVIFSYTFVSRRLMWVGLRESASQ
jgi:hypothetical protein